MFSLAIWIEENDHLLDEVPSGTTPRIHLETAIQQHRPLSLFNSPSTSLLPHHQTSRHPPSRPSTSSHLFHHPPSEGLRFVPAEAANLIAGETIHGLASLPVPLRDASFKPLGGAALISLQQKWEPIWFLIADEKLMIGLRTGGAVDRRLRQAKPATSHLPFGGVNAMFIGDYGQLPPVSDTTMILANSIQTSDLAREGALAYKSLRTSLKLTVVQGQAGVDEESLRF
ncbi:hypothetical protein BDY24DRAFT_388054 [Mrakia frigida]|uniref:uncharacterized protein n=1 Tax=Mrakia frigida TaxID=29902 RepID=UPI003FCC1848